jgi:ABC-2 type transport system ATP-binding protein
MPAILSIESLGKRYQSGHIALAEVDLTIQRGEIFALLGPNGAGKTTLISIICGTVTRSSGTITVAGHDLDRDRRTARSIIGLVPQEIAVDPFSTVLNSVRFSRGLYGKAPNPDYIEQILRDLSLWDKRNARLIELSGGMKRRVMIAKALSHEPELLFLDEPTAGVDVNLRRDMWELCAACASAG